MLWMMFVWGADKEQHDKRLRQLFDRIILTSISRHILSAEDLKPDQEKVRALIDMPQPHDKIALMRFLGVVQYLSNIIPNRSDRSAPLRNLLKWDVV